jgi:hypothetical protein
VTSKGPSRLHQGEQPYLVEVVVDREIRPWARAPGCLPPLPHPEPNFLKLARGQLKNGALSRFKVRRFRNVVTERGPVLVAVAIRNRSDMLLANEPRARQRDAGISAACSASSTSFIRASVET